MSSTAPNVGISPSVAPSERPLTLSLPQDNCAANDTSRTQARARVGRPEKADNGLQFTLRDQSFAGQNGQGGSQANTATIVIPDADQPATPATQIYSRFARVIGIDIRV